MNRNTREQWWTLSLSILATLSGSNGYASVGEVCSNVDAVVEVRGNCEREASGKPACSTLVLELVHNTELVRGPVHSK